MASVRSAWATAFRAIDPERAMCPEISCPDFDKSSAALATV
jgi:hypothetical protein